ncbi:MAG: major capsid protein [Microviridae sp.]|nr:MAG: major capsid protein [Microviridae sp.]
MQTTIGGDRLGSGSKETVSFRNYERSTHDLGYVWRSSMASGTLVPFMNKVALPGDKWDINLNAEVLTLPTIGPLFGSYKVQLDVFEIPIRLYNAKLHNNRLGVGMDMKSILLPKMTLNTANKYMNGSVSDQSTETFKDNEQINASCIYKYLGISGIGSYKPDETEPVIQREFNAVPVLAYWDIYKNYYSNKQEEIGYYIHTEDAAISAAQTPVQAILYDENDIEIGSILDPDDEAGVTDGKLRIFYSSDAVEPDVNQIQIKVTGVLTDIKTVFGLWAWDNSGKVLIFEYCKTQSMLMYPRTPNRAVDAEKQFFGLKKFNLSVIDDIRDSILRWNSAGAWGINGTSPEPYGGPMQPVDGGLSYAMQFSQEGLGIKTYQSDLFNNWINTEWIDGAGGISELTAVQVDENGFTIDALNIASKVYAMLNRIAISGGTYDDWLEAVYTHDRVRGVETPVYCGSLIKELAFEEVVSLSETKEGIDGQKVPLGTLAGRGKLTGKHKGGKVVISVNEPSIILGLVSLTPRVDYSQGNDWSVNLKTMDDFHKPALDGIGFQDLITEQLMWSDTQLEQGFWIQSALGKQPAWINYMTDVNKTYGSFAEENNSMFMTLNRRYERKFSITGGKLADGTTYIDPTKYNNIFAEEGLSSQNFWVQIACNITARRKMSAKIIPNL